MVIRSHLSRHPSTFRRSRSYSTDVSPAPGHAYKLYHPKPQALASHQPRACAGIYGFS
jgi:hypothetical protein